MRGRSRFPLFVATAAAAILIGSRGLAFAQVSAPAGAHPQAPAMTKDFAALSDPSGQNSAALGKAPAAIPPGVAKKDPAKPDLAKPDLAKPDLAKPDLVKPDADKAAPAVSPGFANAPAEPKAASRPDPLSLPGERAAGMSKARAKVDRDDKGVDPEPDVAIKPPSVAPSADTASPGGTKTLDTAKGPAADAPLPPLDAAIKKALDRRDAAEIKGANAAERRRQREALAFFYAAHTFAPVWSADGVAAVAVEPVLARLAHAGDDALSLPTVPIVLKTKGSLEEIAESELALSEAVVAYARQATGSRIEPRSIAPLIGFKPELADAAEALETVAAAGTEAGERLHAFNPAEPRYQALRDKLAELRAAHAPPAAAAIPAGPDLRIGMRDPRVPMIRARFSLDGTPDSEPQNLRYDTEVAAAVAGFQRANGLPASGVLTRRTIVALSGGHPSRLEGELVANMEMWRWMAHDLGADRIEVNVPDFVVTVFHDGAVKSRNRVVVGKTDTPTPLFSNKMQYLIVNPVWNVPESIIRKEMLPKLAADPGYLDRLGYTVVEKNGKLLVRQPSGAKNALGRVKFMFPNDYAVYLHDTPSKALFASARRAFSHGCVRVDQPFSFAESLLGAERGWSEKRFKSMLGDKERYVNLPKPMPIHIEYFTASVDDTGHLDLRDDVYDYIHRIALALGQEG